MNAIVIENAPTEIMEKLGNNIDYWLFIKYIDTQKIKRV